MVRADPQHARRKRVEGPKRSVVVTGEEARVFKALGEDGQVAPLEWLSAAAERGIQHGGVVAADGHYNARGVVEHHAASGMCPGVVVQLLNIRPTSSGTAAVARRIWRRRGWSAE